VSSAAGLHSQRSPSRRRRTRLALLSFFTFFVGAVGFETGVYFFTNSEGVSVTGDEPHYLILARALSHFSPLVMWAYHLDFRTQTLYKLPPGAKFSNIPNHVYAGPHGMVSIHGLGVSALIAPFLAIGGKNLAFIGFFTVEVAGFIYLHQRGSYLAGLTRSGKVVFGLALGGPALWLAGTQLYPDLLTGIGLASALIEVGIVERYGRLTRQGAWVFAAVIAFLPWLHVKNFLPSLVAALAFVAVAMRARAGRASVIVIAVVVTSWVLLLAYNLYYFGHLLGYPQPNPELTKNALILTTGLLFDRDQGLFVQLPTALLGVAGLWCARRSVPIWATATLVSAGAVLLLNGSYTRVPYGGEALAGRFEWTAVPLLLAGCPLLIARLDLVPRRVWGAGAVIGALWVVQAIPILDGSHVYYNASNPPPWDPSRYPGWWPRIDVLLPQLSPRGPLVGAPGYALVIEGALAAWTLWFAVRLTRTERIDGRYLGSGVALVALTLAYLSAIAHYPLPAGPAPINESELSHPLVAGALPRSDPRVNLEYIGTGTYRGVLTYRLLGPTASGTLMLGCTHPTGSSRSRPLAALLPGTDSTAATIHCRAGTLWYQTSVGARSQLAIQSLVVTKTAN